MQQFKANHIKRVYYSIEQMLSNKDNPTPIVQLNKVIPFTQTKVFAKLEWYNPFGAVKDRIASNLIYDAKKSGSIEGVKNLVEPTSGNTGFALTMFGQFKGYKLKSPISSMIPLEKRTLLKFFGCNVLEVKDTLCPAPGAPEGAIAKAQETAKLPGYHMLDQYSNIANPQGHYNTTGPEVWMQTDQKITHFIASLGTCGTLSGVGKYLKEKDPTIKLIGIHPEVGHDIPGVRSLVQLKQTKLFFPELYDELIEVSNREAYDMCLRINREESIIAGPSSGLAVAGALKVLKDQKDALAIVVFPDNAFKYASSFRKHFPEMFKDLTGSSPSESYQNEKEKTLNEMIELSRNEFNTIEIEQAFYEREEKNPLYIDVRSSEQYAFAHIKGAVNIPIENLIKGDIKIPKDKNYPIITVCNIGNQSIQGLLILKSRGYSNVLSLNKGTRGWIEKGLPVEE